MLLLPNTRREFLLGIHGSSLIHLSDYKPELNRLAAERAAKQEADKKAQLERLMKDMKMSGEGNPFGPHGVNERQDRYVACGTPKMKYADAASVMMMRLAMPRTVMTNTRMTRPSLVEVTWVRRSVGFGHMELTSHRGRWSRTDIRQQDAA